VAVDETRLDAFTALAEANGCPVTPLGVSEGTGTDAALTVDGLFAVPLAELRAAGSATLPAALG